MLNNGECVDCVGAEAYKGIYTLGFALGFSCSSFLAAASIDAAAPKSSVSAMNVVSSGSTHSDPKRDSHRLNLKRHNTSG